MNKIIVSLFLSLFLLTSCSNDKKNEIDEFFINGVIVNENNCVVNGNNEGEKMSISFNDDHVDIDYSIDKNIHNIHSIIYESKLNIYEFLDDKNFGVENNRVYLKCNFTCTFNVNDKTYTKDINKGHIIDVKDNKIQFIFDLNEFKDVSNFRMKISLDGKAFNKDNFWIIYHNNKGEKNYENFI